MVDLYELKQLTAFADLGTLHRVAEGFHLSTPCLLYTSDAADEL